MKKKTVKIVKINHRRGVIAYEIPKINGIVIGVVKRYNEDGGRDYIHTNNGILFNGVVIKFEYN